MIPLPSGVRVWLAVGRTDMRRGMNALALQVQEALRRDPHAGDLYVFRAATVAWSGPPVRLCHLTHLTHPWRRSGIDRAFYRGGVQQIAREVTLRFFPADVDDCVFGTGWRATTNASRMKVMVSLRDEERWARVLRWTHLRHQDLAEIRSVPGHLRGTGRGWRCTA